MPHIHEKIDFTVEVFVVYKDKVLLRLHDKHGIWLSVGGHIELDENPNQAALREVKEEVGLDIKLFKDPKQFERKEENYEELIPPKFMNIHRISPTHEHVTLTYFGISETDQVVPEKEGDKWLWASKADLETLDLSPSIKFYAQKALEELSQKS